MTPIKKIGERSWPHSLNSFVVGLRSCIAFHWKCSFGLLERDHFYQIYYIALKIAQREIFEKWVLFPREKKMNFLDKNTVAKISLLEMVERTLFRKWKDDQIRSFVLKFWEFHNTQKTIMNSIWWRTSFASSIYYKNVLYLN